MVNRQAEQPLKGMRLGQAGLGSLGYRVVPVVMQ